jgi:hypothetical protein
VTTLISITRSIERFDVRLLMPRGAFPHLKHGSLAEFKHIAAGEPVAAFQSKRYRPSAPLIKRRLRCTKLEAKY